MNSKEQLNIEIAEKLMGLECRPIGEGIVKDKLYWRNPWNGFCYWEGLPNYFTLGWEQVEDKLAELGFTLTAGINYEGAIAFKYWYEAKSGYKISNQYYSIGYGKTREEARYKELKQAFPEILKRI